MSESRTIALPDMGDIDTVEVIEVLVSAGDKVVEEQSIITVESDKASTDVPSPVNGTITSVIVKVGDKVSVGSELAAIDVDSTAGVTAADSATSDAANSQSATSEAAPSSSTGVAAPTPPTDTDMQTALVVIGAGPGGYTAAFRAADLGMDVILIERYPNLGGVCLNVGCIPSKALLHTAAIIDEAADMQAHGVTFGEPQIDIDKLRHFKEGVIGQLTDGLAGLAKQRKVTVVYGDASFTGPNTLEVDNSRDGTSKSIGFSQAIIAAGSQSIRIPGLPYEDDRLMDSTSALELKDIPKRLLIIGGGIIGLEMGCVYAALGSAVSVVELSPGLMPGADTDLVKPLERRLKKN